ncbi:S-layer protein [Nostoc sp. LEGE 06077]|uniref:S-layer protein n=1 Tax=Nostoc sp. LEGE 06077 TaxID=915325 RepID=UPI001882778D|nr:S-layer protein [Nostoc sp. LEGE 06077]MBE9210546.1 S-layer protein [Nostoc sp. LEGE 06077]
MNRKILTAVLLLTISSLVAPAKALNPTNNESQKLTQVQNACINNQAETLPNPFSDVPTSHWAFKAVMTMHYCGAFCQATPPILFEKLRRNQSQQPTNSQDYFPATNKQRNSIFIK